MVTISACIITRNESTQIKDTILHVYPYVDEIIINDGSDDDSTLNEILNMNNTNNTTNILNNTTNILNKIKIINKKGNTTINFADERNEMQNLSSCGYVLHIDTDERFDEKFLKSMKNLIENYIKNNELPILFRFPRKGDSNDINIQPDYQIRLLNKKYSKWIRSVHEIPIIIKKDSYIFNEKLFNINNLITLNKFPIIHLHKDRKEARKRWDILKDKDMEFKKRNLLICTMFKNSEKWINDVILCIEKAYYFNESLENNNLKIRIAFLDGKSEDDTSKKIKNYIGSTSILDIWYKFYEYMKSKSSRYNKLADLRNYLIETSIKDIYNNKLNDDDLVIFMDSDIKFDKNIIHELIIDMDKSSADIIAPLVCIEDNGAFGNNYFYDTLAFRNIDNEQFSHFRPYIFGDIKRSKIKKEKHEKIQKALEKIDTLNTLRKINWEFNMNTPLNNTFPDNLFKEAYSLIDINIPIEVNSVGSFYLMKYKVAKEIKYNGKMDSEQVGFCNSACSKGFKIFVSQRLKVLHINLEKYGLKWH